MADPRSIARASRPQKNPQHSKPPTDGGYGHPGGGSYGANQVPAYSDWNLGRPGLARDPQVFTNALFAPSAPINAPGINEPNDEGLTDPRRYEAPVAWNMPMGAPGSEGTKLASFGNLRTLSDAYSVVNACIDVRIGEIRGLGWDIVPTKEAAKALRGDSGLHKDFQERRAKAMRFFKRPDTDYADYSTWLAALLYDTFQIDALALYLQPTRLKGRGLLGSNLAELALIDGASIRPMVDVHGAKPKPPNVAYQQYMYGVPRTDLMSAPEPELLNDLKLEKEYRSNQLLYLPYTPRRWTPYGFPPVERALVPVMTGLARQQYQLDYFTEGTVPGVYISPGDSSMTAASMRSLQDALNGMVMDLGHKHRVVVLPPGSTVMPQKPNSLADQFDEIVMTAVCMAFNVLPIELGLTPRVSTVQNVSASNQMQRAANSIIERKALLPLLLFLKSTIFDYVLQVLCGQADMEWMWEGIEQGVDEESQVNILVGKINSGLATIDEARNVLGEQPYGLPMTTEPLVFTPVTGYMALGSIDPSTGRPIGEQPNAEAGQEPTDPGDGSGPAKPKPKPSSSSPGTQGADAGTAEADRQVGSKPGAGGGKVDTKAALAELDQLRRRLKQNKSIEDWECRWIPQGVLDSMVYALRSGESPLDVVEKARESVAGSDLERRESALRPIKEAVVSGLGKALNGLRTGRIAGPEFIATGIELMTRGTARAMHLGAAHALSDRGHPGHHIAKAEGDGEELDYSDLAGEVSAYWKSQAQGQADDGRHYLERLMRDAIIADASVSFSGRLGLYGQQAQSSYENAFGVTTAALSYTEAAIAGDPGVTLEDGTVLLPGEQAITWNTGGGETCELCMDREGQMFTMDTLPGWPGDGFFGELCGGGPNCKCSLTYEDVTEHNGIRLGGYAAERAGLAADQRDRMQQINDLRQTFVESLPQAAQARAQTLDAARRQLAAELGAHQGHTAWPMDVAASDVRDRVGIHR